MENIEYDYRITCLKKYGKTSLSYLTLSDSLSIFHGEWEGYFAYKEFLRAAIFLGDPIVSDE